MNEITVRLSKDTSSPLYKQLYAFIKNEIVSGSYPFNVKLPSKRQLSSSLKCSQNTVQAAYNQLMVEGYIEARPKSGYYVCKLDGILNISKVPEPSFKFAAQIFNYKYDFSHQGVDLDHFPFSTWRKISKEVISEYDVDLLKTGDSKGSPELRASIAGYLHHSRGVNCSPDQIVISSGTEFLLQLLVQLFSEDYIYALENPGYEKLNMIFKSNRVGYQPVSLDSSGMRPDELLFSRANVACVTPSHQFPTGRIMPISRRIQLLNWANEKTDRYIIEDDYDSEFKYDGKPIPSLQGLDQGGKVIYIGAFSKSLTPALRISYMVLPEELARLYSETLNFYICPVPTIEQKTLHRFICEGHFERHLNRMRHLYKLKREKLLSTIQELLPSASIEGASAGLHFVLNVNNGMSEAELIKSASDQNIKVYGLSQYYFDKVSCNQTRLLLGFATLRERNIPEAVSLLRDAWVK